MSKVRKFFETAVNYLFNGMLVFFPVAIGVEAGYFFATRRPWPGVVIALLALGMQAANWHHWHLHFRIAVKNVQQETFKIALDMTKTVFTGMQKQTGMQVEISGREVGPDDFPEIDSKWKN